MNYILFHYRQVHILAHRETSYPKFEEHVGIYIYDVELDSWNVKYFHDCKLGKYSLDSKINMAFCKEVHESVIFSHCARPSSLVNR